MRKKIFLFLIILLSSSLCFHDVKAQPRVTSNLQKELAEKAEDEFIPVNLRLAAQYDDQSLYRQSRLIPDRDQRREFVVTTLQEFSKQQQSELLSFLNEMKSQGKVKNIRPFWIGNLVNCKVQPEVILELKTRKDLARIDHNKTRHVLLETENPGQETATEPDRLRTNDLAWNVTLVNADQVWQQGYTGEGVVVAVLDTGVNYDHLDIQDNMWEHPDYPNHGYNFADDNHNTMDIQGHGTHCAGTVAGTGAAGTATGIAPGATIMALQVLNDQGGGNEADVWAGIQFGVEYGAHILSLSLGWRHGWDPDRAMWRTAMNNALNAGVIASVAAGNIPWIGGQPPPNEVHTPGDVPPPWLHPDQTLQGGISAVVSVGATDSGDDLADFSCKGPVTWQEVNYFNDYPYDPGMGLMRPDLVAPGVSVLSLLHSDNTGYTTKSGTSMATPAVAGAMALMLSKNPDLLPEDLSQMLEESAMSQNNGKNNQFGSGRLDALEAANQTPGMFVRYVDHEVDDSHGNDTGNINPGEHIKLNITLTNRIIDDLQDVEAKLEVFSPFVTLVDSTATLGDFSAGDTLTFEGVFSFDVAENIPGNYHIPFAVTCYSAENPEETWTSHFNEMAHAPFLEFSGLSVSPVKGSNLLIPGEISDVQITLKNTGQMESGQVEASMTTGGEWTTVIFYEGISLPSLQPGEQEDMVFQVVAFSETPLGTTTGLTFTALTEIYEFEQTKEVVIGPTPQYNDGDIPTTYLVNVTTESNALEPGQMSVTIPENAIITGVDVEYSMTSVSPAHVGVQRSFLRCVSEGGETEPEVYAIEADTTGTVHYQRTGLEIANNVEGGGEIEFELHAFRTWGGSGSNTDWVFVPDSSWRLIVHYELPLYEVTFRVSNQFGELLEDALIEAGNKSAHTGPGGEAMLELPKTLLYYSVLADNHRPMDFQLLEVIPETDLVEVSLIRVFEVVFNIIDPDGVEIPDAVIIFENDTLDPGQYVLDDLEDGTYSFLVSAEGFQTHEGVAEIIDQDLEIQVVLYPEGTEVEAIQEKEIRVFPNPAGFLVNIQSGEKIKELRLFDILGNMVYHTPVQDIQYVLDVAGFKPGLYFLQLTTQQGTATERLQISR